MSTTLLSRSALSTLAEAARRSTQGLRLIVNAPEQTTSFAEKLEAIASSVGEGTLGAIEVHKETAETGSDRPSLSIVRGDRLVARYLAVPEDSEAPPFLELMLALVGGTPVFSRPARLVSDFNEACDLTVFIAPGCPNCPHAVRAAGMLAAASPLVTLSVIDATEFQELAAQFKITSVPTTIIDGAMTMVGVIPIKKLARAISERDQPESEGEIFASLITGGRFDEAARRLQTGQAAEAFMAMWSKSSLETRIGLAMVADSVLEKNPRDLRCLVVGLIETLESDNPAIRGDSADLLGKIGDQKAVPALTRLLNDPDEDVAEAVEDALEALS